MSEIAHGQDRNAIASFREWAFHDKSTSRRLARSAMVVISSVSVLLAIGTLVYSWLT